MSRRCFRHCSFHAPQRLATQGRCYGNYLHNHRSRQPRSLAARGKSLSNKQTRSQRGDHGPSSPPTSSTSPSRTTADPANAHRGVAGELRVPRAPLHQGPDLVEQLLTGAEARRRSQVANKWKSFNLTQLYSLDVRARSSGRPYEPRWGIWHHR